MKTPFNIIIPPELPLYRKAARLIWLVTLRLIAFIVIPFLTLVTALRHAIEEDSLSWFAHNLWKAYRRSTRHALHLIAGHYTAGYYRLFLPSGGCGPYKWFKQEPENPKDGSGDKWRLGRGY